ncbi:DUF6612 family protein [Peribacillus loiseleuriae]|uniref:DUF6612 family protein n=1 Tax=Peribacillus loiseleuriae TaxID=1679170 RepID=UPI0038148740
MKLKSLALPLFALVLLLSACGQKATPVSENGNSEAKTKTEKPMQKEESLTLEKVFEKTITASKDLKSLTLKMENDQTITSSSNSEPTAMTSTIDMDLIQDPLSLYQVMTMNIPGEDAIKTESYFTKQGFFMYEPAQGAWMKLPDEMSTELLKATEQQGDPATELKKMQEFIEDFTFEQDSSSYILTLNASAEKFNTFMQEQLAQSFGQSAGFDLQSVDVSELKYSYTIDKKTFYPTAMTVDMSFKTVEGSEEVTLKQKTNVTFSNYNGINEITIPEEVIKSAQEIELPH